ncbi:hypothetical protein AAMO2058_000779600 [Amorphochlora amoebiformis]
MVRIAHGYVVWAIAAVCSPVSDHGLFHPKPTLRTRNLRAIAKSKFESGEVVWITGASSGLGASIARKVAEKLTPNTKNRLVLSGRNMRELKNIQSQCIEISPNSLEVDVVPFDLSDTESIPLIAEDIVNRYGGVDSMVLCGGVSSRGSIVNSTCQLQHKVMKINHLSSVALSLGVLPSMLEKKQGRIIHINSVQGRFALPFRGAYGASKHASTAFFDSLRAEVSGHGIQVSSFQPGYIRTNLSLNAFTSQGNAHGKMDESTAKGMSPEDVADMVWKYAWERPSPEVVMAPLNARLALGLRALLPRLYFRIMEKRANRDT